MMERSDFLPTRQSLLSRLRSWNDDEGWHEFYRLYWKLIYGFAVRKGLSDQEAQEVVQETVIAVAKTMPGFEYDASRCSFKSWLRHLAEKKIADQYRRKEKEKPLDELLESDALEDPAVSGNEDLWDQEWQQHLVSGALERLKTKVSPKAFRIFHRHVVQEFSAREVAQTLEVNISEVYLAKHRLGRLFRKELERLKDFS